MSGAINGNAIIVRQGDSFKIDLCVQKCGRPVDLSGAELLMQVRDKQTQRLMFAVEGTPVDLVNGKIALLITADKTNIPVGDYNTDIQLTTSDGSVNTIFPSNVNQIGVFRITEQVTQET